MNPEYIKGLLIAAKEILWKAEFESDKKIQIKILDICCALNDVIKHLEEEINED